MDSTDMHAGATPDHDPAETQEWIDALKGVLIYAQRGGK